MLDVPWYMLSPSPYSLAVWSFLAYFQAKKLNPFSWREWMKAFSICAFTLGFVVLPFDCLWVIFQNIRFGYLYPDERWFTLFSSLARNLLLLLLCIYESREVHEYLNFTALSGHVDFIILFTIWFGLAPDPSWTDWTYAYRFGYGGVRTAEAFLISHVFMKSIQALIYYYLWKVERIES